MAGQNGNTSSSTIASPATVPLQGADLFKAIHDAFLVGRNLFELKSRIIVASYDIDNIDSSRPPIVPSFDLVDTLLKEIKNPRSRPDVQKLPVEPSDIFWATSVWRAMFKRIVDLQNPNIDTAGTIYNIPTIVDKALETFPYLYLYPTGDPNYTSIGVQRLSDPTFLENFRLYDATLRALNCLTILYIQPGEALDFTVVKNYQSEMIENILKADPLFNPLDDKKTALKRFTGITIRLLEAWDGYLRESYYTGTDDEDNEIELIAYEAGRSMTSLSWGISALAVPIEDELDEIDHSYKQIKAALKEKQEYIDLLDVVLAQIEERHKILNQLNTDILEYDKVIASIKTQVNLAYVQHNIINPGMDRIEGAFTHKGLRAQLIYDVDKEFSSHLNQTQLVAQLQTAFAKYDKRQQLIEQRDDLLQQEKEAQAQRGTLQDIKEELKDVADCHKKKFIDYVKQSRFKDIVTDIEKTFVTSDRRKIFLDPLRDRRDLNSRYANYISRIEIIFSNDKQRQQLNSKIIELIVRQSDDDEKQSYVNHINAVFKNDTTLDSNGIEQLKKDLKEIFVKQTPYIQSMQDINTAFTDYASRQEIIARIGLILQSEPDQAQLLTDIKATLTAKDTLQQLIDKLKADTPQKTGIIAQINDTFTSYNNQQQLIKRLEAFLKQQPAQTQQQDSALFTDLTNILDLRQKQQQLNEQIEDAMLQHTDYPQILAQLDAAFTAYRDDQIYLDTFPQDTPVFATPTQKFDQSFVPSVDEVKQARNDGVKQKSLLDKSREKLIEIAGYDQFMKKLDEVLDRYDYYSEYLPNQLEHVFHQHEERVQRMRQLYQAWQAVFNERDIIHVQYNTASLSRSLDTSYKALNSETVGTAAASSQSPGTNSSTPSSANSANSQNPGSDSNIQTSANGANPQNASSGSNPPTSGSGTNTQNSSTDTTNSTQTQDGAGQPDAEAPSVALDAIVHSLDYWESAIDWIGSPEAQQRICAAHNVMYVPGDDPIMPYELSRQLRNALIEQADIWESLITCQRTLSDITNESVTQKILSTFMEKCENAVWQDADIAAKQAEKKLTPITLGVAIAGILLIAIVILILLLPQAQGLKDNPLIGGGLSGIFSVLSFLGLGAVVKNWNIFPGSATTSTTSTTSTTTTHPSSGTTKSGTTPTPASTSTTSTSSSTGSAPAQGSAAQNVSNNSQTAIPNNAPPDIWTQLSHVLQATGSTIVKTYEKCQEVVNDELQGLDQRVSVAAPLVEFFVLNSSKESSNGVTKKNTNRQIHKYDFSIHDSYDFLTNVIWTHGDREEELQRLVYAAAGPIGTFIGGKLNATNNSPDNTATQGSSSAGQSSNNTT